MKTDKKNNQNLKNDFLKNSLFNLFSTIINRIGALIFTIILARVLMPEGYGAYSIVLSTAMVFYTFTDLGINQALLRYMSVALSREEKKANTYYRFLLKIKFVLTIVFSLLLLTFSYPISFYLFHNPGLFIPMIIASVYIFILSFDSFYQHLFYPIGRFKYVGIRETVFQTLRICLVLIFIGFSYYVSGVFISLIITSLALIAYSLYYTKKLAPIIYKKSDEEIDTKKVLKFVGYLTIASISSVFFSYIDSIMLGIFVSPEYVGYYRAAFGFILGIAGFFTFTNAALLPLFIKVNSSKKNHIINMSFKYLSIITIPSFFGLLVLGKYFIVLLYDYSYLPATLPMYFLLILIFPTVMVNLLLTFFSAEEKPEIFAKLIILSCFINIILNYILIKSFLPMSQLWATAGAAIATVISWLFYFFASLYFLKKEFNLSINFSSMIKPMIASMVMFGVLFYTLNFIKDMTPIIGAVEVIIGVIIYFVTLIIIKGVSISELNNFKILFKNSKFKIPFLYISE